MALQADYVHCCCSLKGNVVPWFKGYDYFSKVLLCLKESEHITLLYINSRHSQFRQQQTYKYKYD